MIAALALLLVLSIAAAEPTGMLTLACEGTVTHQPEGKPQPIWMGIIITFSDRTVQGFGFPGTINITGMNEAIVAFEGSDPKALTQIPDWGIHGIVDRVTGILEATSTISNLETHDDEMQAHAADVLEP